MARRRLWETPKVRRDEDEQRHRRVTWLELFFDLFFVAVIAQLAHQLGTNLSREGIFAFLLLFVPVWWVWIGATYYIERFETEGLEMRLTIFAFMLPVTGMAATALHAFSETFSPFALSYAAARMLTGALWVRGGLHDRDFRPVAIRLAAGFSLSVTLAVLSAFLSEPLRFIAFGGALTVDLLTPFTTIAQQRKLPRFSTSKLPERFGLFVIIVLGESVVGVVKGISGEHHLTGTTFADGILGVALGFGVWWIYFDFIARRPFKHGLWAFAWSYLHLPLVAGIVATGVGISAVIGQEGALDSASRSLIAGSLGLSLFTMGLIELTLERAFDEPTHAGWSPLLKLVCGFVAASLAAAPLSSSPTLLALLLVVLAVVMFYGAYVWFTQERAS